jgi:hypothetical protein
MLCQESFSFNFEGQAKRAKSSYRLSTKAETYFRAEQFPCKNEREQKLISNG